MKRFVFSLSHVNVCKHSISRLKSKLSMQMRFACIYGALRYMSIYNVVNKT